MVNFLGKYQHEKNENLDAYFKAIGVPYIPRKMMVATSPTLEITYDEQTEQWTITIITMLRTTVTKFKLDEDYEENMPGGVVIRNNTIQEGDKLITTSIPPNGSKTSRTYEFTETHCIITYKHDDSGIEAKRYYKRV